MDPSLSAAIAGKLEAGKIAGWLSDYLVAWHGPREHLAPEITSGARPTRTTMRSAAI
ncbi:MAG: hypothetical protein WDO17_02805 [Alphaproteobacteria bacterium]